MKKKRKNTIAFDPNVMLLSEQSAFTVKEAYKTLRTNVIFSLPGSDSKCVGVVSADRGDGKSSIALNLAISFAQINKKVIMENKTFDQRLVNVFLTRHQVSLKNPRPFHF